METIKGEVRIEEIVVLSGRYEKCHFIKCDVMVMSGCEVYDCTFDSCDLQTEGDDITLVHCLFCESRSQKRLSQYLESA